jgi:N-alpha-acetyltransferase 40
MSITANKAKDKKAARRAAAQRALQIQALVKTMKAQPDALEPFPAFKLYDRKGLLAELCYYTAESLPQSLLEWAFDLAKRNMEAAYDACQGWGWKDKKKRSELLDADARFIVVTAMDRQSVVEDPTLPSDTRPQDSGQAAHIADVAQGQPLAFVHLRYEIEREIPVAYVWDIQVEGSMQGRGLGRFLLQVVELIARKGSIERLMLTVFRTNVVARHLYERLGFVTDEDSPGEEEGYEILSKALPLPKATTGEGNVGT